MRFEGKFNPPALGTTVAPIEIAGPGACVLNPNTYTLEVTGNRSKSQRAFVALALTAVIVGGLFLAFKLQPDVPANTIQVAMAVAVAAIVQSALVGKKRE